MAFIIDITDLKCHNHYKWIYISKGVHITA